MIRTYLPTNGQRASYIRELKLAADMKVPSVEGQTRADPELPGFWTNPGACYCVVCIRGYLDGGAVW